MSSINGIVAVLPVPFHEDETIDEDSFHRVVNFVATNRLAGMCVPAYGSEFYKLTESEREWLVSTAVSISAGRTPVIAQANHGAREWLLSWRGGIRHWERASSVLLCLDSFRSALSNCFGMRVESLNDGSASGLIGYHLRPGEHALTPYDWDRFLMFADQHMKK